MGKYLVREGFHLSMAKSAALFDFDKTIINKDTGLAFILFALLRHPARTLIAILCTPFAALCFASIKTRFIGNSIYLWIATCGLSLKETVFLRRQFIDFYLQQSSVTFFSEAIAALKEHTAKGQAVYIVSGSSTWMVKGLMQRLGFKDIVILGSEEKRFAGGMVANLHCFAENKVKKLQAYLADSESAFCSGYSDSASDIPLLSLCHNKHAINPSSRSKKKFIKAFGHDIKMLLWR